jgi:carboxymethylenebutenolidase
MGTMIQLTAADGHAFAAYQAEPAGKAKGAVVVAQEIFGVNSHIKSVADGYASAGYLAIAPALYDRVQRGYETGYSQPEIQAGIALMQGLKWDDTLKDTQAAIEHARPTGKIAVVGYCWGGTVAWLAATRLTGVTCSIPYYGGGIFGFKDEKPKCPVMFQFAEQDQNPTLEQARQIAGVQPSAIANYYAAGHGFNCDQRGSYNAQAAALAKARTLEFLSKHIG